MNKNIQENNIIQNIDIGKFPIFNNIDKDILERLLKNAKIFEYKKGHVICRCGEPANNFYIVVSGLVKLFKSNLDGDEIVFDLVGEGKTLTEISLGDIYGTNVQVVEDAKILAIPMVQLQATIHDSHVFALNMLGLMSGCAQNLVAHIEQLTLKTVTQRIGWFLLKLLMEKSGADKKTIKLPYDKSLISEYLGMRPETFSRTLQQMKEYGVSVNSKEVTFKNPKALCDFCTAELAAKCSDSEGRSCRHRELLI